MSPNGRSFARARTRARGRRGRLAVSGCEIVTDSNAQRAHRVRLRNTKLLRHDFRRAWRRHRQRLRQVAGVGRGVLPIGYGVTIGYGATIHHGAAAIGQRACEMEVVVEETSTGADCCCTEASPSILAAMSARMRLRSSVVRCAVERDLISSGTAMPATCPGRGCGVRAPTGVRCDGMQASATECKVDRVGEAMRHSAGARRCSDACMVRRVALLGVAGDAESVMGAPPSCAAF